MLAALVKLRTNLDLGVTLIEENDSISPWFVNSQPDSLCYQNWPIYFTLLYLIETIRCNTKKRTRDMTFLVHVLVFYLRQSA